MEKGARPQRPLALGLLALALVGCPNEPSPGSGTTSSSPSATSSGSSASATPPASASGPSPADRITKVLNPKGEEPYSGPTATLRGIVRIRGDEPPTESHKIPPGCGQAAATYGKRFRVGQDGTLADVLVAVTGHGAYVPARSDHQEISISECAYSTRTVALTYGQHLRIKNLDQDRSYLPVLRGARTAAKLVAVPLGSVKLYVREPIRHLLVDELNHGSYMQADVFVVKFTTHHVTGLDGRYEIAGIPVGKVKVSALLPTLPTKAHNQLLEIKEGDNTLDLTIDFDAEKDARPTPAEK